MFVPLSAGLPDEKKTTLQSIEEFFEGNRCDQKIRGKALPQIFSGLIDMAPILFWVLGLNYFSWSFFL